MNWKRLVCAIALASIFGSQLDELRFRQDESPAARRAWVEWLETYIPAAAGRNLA